MLAFAVRSALTPLVTAASGLILIVGFIAAAGTGAASFSVPIDSVARYVEVEKRSVASGMINACSSFGQFIIAPVTQFLVSVASWSLPIIGAANVIRSFAVGCGTRTYRSKYLPFRMYASRAALILAYLVAPETALSSFIFAAGLGLTWLTTVTSSATIIGKLFGTRYIATLFELTLLSHQTGGFPRAWLAGIAVDELGNYTIMWSTDAVLAMLAALINPPMREARMFSMLAPA